MANEITTLVKSRGGIKSQITRFVTYISKLEYKDDEIEQIVVRLEKIEALWKEFDKIQSKIEDIDESDQQELERFEFEESFFNIVGKAKTAIRTITNNQNGIPNLQGRGANREPNGNVQGQIREINNIENNPLNDNANIESNNTGVKLPTMNLPIFDGNYERWLEFYDSFQAIVEKNNKLSDIQKLYYLRLSVKGTAAEVIQSLDTSAESYRVAWDLLKRRFEKKKLIVAKHMQGIFDIPVIHRESSSLLQQALDSLIKHTRALKMLEADNWDTILIHLMQNKLDSNTKRDWRDHVKRNEDAKLLDFIEFLEDRVAIIDEPIIKASASKPAIHSAETNKYKYKRIEHVAHVGSIGTKAICVVCKGDHAIFNCNKFRDLSVPLRINEVKKHRLCFNCLRSNHAVQECRSSYCKYCNKKHSTLLHIDVSNSVDQSSHGKARKDEPQVSVMQATMINPKPNCLLQNHEQSVSHVVLATAMILIYDSKGNSHECRALLDNGSQSNFITHELSKRLKLFERKEQLSIGGIGASVTKVLGSTHATIKSRINNFQTKLPFLILDKITVTLPSCNINRSELPIPENLLLADPHFNTSRKIDMLISASIFWELLCIGQIKMGKNLPILQKNKFGWIVSGQMVSNRTNHLTQIHSFNSVIHIQEQLQDFWRIEKVPRTCKMSREERECERHFLENFKRNENGRFVVALPFKSDRTALGESKQAAIKRLHAMERKFSRQPEMQRQYIDVLDEYLALNHMQLVDESVEKPDACYLPHHAVVKTSSSTTKLRVVFDGSCKTSSGASVNDALAVGPTIQQDLFSIVLRFRQHRYVITADIEKMYRQILVKEEHRDLQRMVWRKNAQEPMQIYRLNTLTHGLAPSAFLAIRCLVQVAIDYETKYPRTSKIIRRDFSVDDLITGADSLEELKEIKDEVIEILGSAGFQLRKWTSNESTVIDSAVLQPTVMESAYREAVNSNCDFSHEIKTLGLYWDSKADLVRYHVKDPDLTMKVTKRTILSIVSQLFDPLGLVGPATIKAKIILQKLWQLNLEWDESIPSELHTSWLNYWRQLSRLRSITIPRHSICKKFVNVQMHGFCDASEDAYGACIYLRSTNSITTQVSLLCAKSRVAPLKTVSLPRLELCGAVLLANLASKVMEVLDVEINDVFYWCDSTIALSWIDGEPHRWKTFISNRVAEIHKLTDKNKWLHVNSESNPADVISRGINPDLLENLKLWWNGPDWLVDEQNQWPNQDVQLEDNSEVLEERKQVLAFHVTDQQDCNIINKFSSFNKLVRVTAYCLRFARNCTKSRLKVVGTLTTSELEYATKVLVRVVQASEFANEARDLEANKNIQANSKLNSLYPFLDNDGLIRVGGRLRHATIAYDKKHPYVLPMKHAFTEMLIQHEHLVQLHSGPQALLASIRHKYWIIRGREAVRRVLQKCIVCIRARPVSSEQLMGNLPINRISQNRPFINCGIDYAGPLAIKVSRNKSGKAYLCLFVCFSTKAVHLEIASDLSTAAFLNALKRFISRRGKCSNIYSDNGTNFVGAHNEIKALGNLLKDDAHRNQTQRFCTDNNMSWHFIPARSPHMGGLWEAAVKSAKTQLKKVIGGTLLTFEELATLMIQIEACLNSRPLSPLSNSPTDLDALTPGHFLIGEPLTCLPETDLQTVSMNRLTRYQLLTKLRQHFWDRWSREYLTQLQQRRKWTKTRENELKVGSLVLLKEDNLPSMVWRMGRITQLHPGSDGLTRVVSVKTSSNIVKRSLPKIVLLPIEDKSNEDN